MKKINFNIPQVDRVYLTELQSQCTFALTAVTASKSVLQDSRPNSVEFWYHIQMFLTSTANIHKMLYNSKASKYRAHHRYIRNEYNFPEINLQTEKEVRNRFEHYDERIVDWINKSKHHNIATSNIMPKNFIAGNIDFFKNYDPIEDILSFDDEEFHVESTTERIVNLYEHIEGILEP